jgi:hypothetical protein
LVWLGFIAVVLLILGGYYLAHRGLFVRVTNKGPGGLRNVRVKVTGNDYLLGEIAEGESKILQIEPTGESHVEVTFTEEEGQFGRVVAGHFEPGFNGEIVITIKNGKLESVQGTPTPGPF